ncbi:MAG: hypothetical protein IH786_10495, partial [Proteobacteria bacterium]|nr:hypothetical protein [Pseudomonadota bacterium]
MASQLNYGVGHTAVAKPDGPIGRAPSKLAQDHSGAPTAAQEIKGAVETRPSGRVDDGAVQEPSVDLPALSLEEPKNLTAIEKGSEECVTPPEIYPPPDPAFADDMVISHTRLLNSVHPPTESIAVDLPGLSLEELMTFEAIEGTSSYKWKPITELSVDLPALSLEGLRNLTVSNEDFEESETPERTAVNHPTSPEHGGGANFTSFNLNSIIVQLPDPLVSFAPDIDFDETEGDSIFAVLSDPEGTTTAVNNPTSTVTAEAAVSAVSDSDATADQVSESAANGTAVGVT